MDVHGGDLETLRDKRASELAAVGALARSIVAGGPRRGGWKGDGKGDRFTKAGSSY